MVSLYKYRGQIDLILTDPPYNTGEDFRYNDRWDEDPDASANVWLRSRPIRATAIADALKSRPQRAVCRSP